MKLVCYPPRVSETALRLVVEGRVQGVCFRFFTCDVAQELGLRGWVRNRSDGSVEIEAAGPEPALERLKERLRVGPPQARVTRLTAERLERGPAGAGFRVTY